MIHATGSSYQEISEALGKARHRFYEIYSLVRRSRPGDTPHDDVRAALYSLRRINLRVCLGRSSGDGFPVGREGSGKQAPEVHAPMDSDAADGAGVGSCTLSSLRHFFCSLCAVSVSGRILVGNPRREPGATSWSE